MKTLLGKNLRRSLQNPLFRLFRLYRPVVFIFQQAVTLLPDSTGRSVKKYHNGKIPPCQYKSGICHGFVKLQIPDALLPPREHLKPVSPAREIKNAAATGRAGSGCE